MRWGHAARIEAIRNTYKVLIRKPEGRKTLGRPSRIWEENIRMDLREIGCEGVDRIHLAQDRDQWRAVVNMVTKLRVAQKAGNFLTS
jgi:hypothetical protein